MTCCGLSEIDQSDLALNLNSTDVNSMAQLFITDRTLLAKQRSLRLTFEPYQPLPHVDIDQMLVGQALSVLLTNALNYTPHGGEITVTTREVANDGHRWVVVSVRDTGPGISAEEQPKLFQRFYRGRCRAKIWTPLGRGLASPSPARLSSAIKVVWKSSAKVCPAGARPSASGSRSGQSLTVKGWTAPTRTAPLNSRLHLQTNARAKRINSSP